MRGILIIIVIYYPSLLLIILFIRNYIIANFVENKEFDAVPVKWISCENKVCILVYLYNYL